MGDVVSIESGQLDLVATNDTTIAGVVLETRSGMTTGTDVIEVIIDDDAIYAFFDANARLVGATLDLAGLTGAITLAATSNVDVMVVATSDATQETLVTIAHGEHWRVT